MPKAYHARLEVPSGSRTNKLFDWLNKLLEPHGMKVTCLRTEDGTEQIATPGTILLPGEPQLYELEGYLLNGRFHKTLDHQTVSESDSVITLFRELKL